MTAAYDSYTRINVGYRSFGNDFRTYNHYDAPSYTDVVFSLSVNALLSLKQSVVTV